MRQHIEATHYVFVVHAVVSYGRTPRSTIALEAAQRDLPYSAARVKFGGAYRPFLFFFILLSLFSLISLVFVLLYKN
jgi:hypothetical protein